LEAVRTVMELSMEGRKGRPKKKWLNGIECDTRTAGICAWRMWEIGPNGSLERRWPTPNKWDKGEGDDE